MWLFFNENLVKEKQECPRKFFLVTGTLKHLGDLDLLSFFRKPSSQQFNSENLTQI